MKLKHIILSLFIITLASCTDENNDPAPVTGDSRDKFTGTWLCNEGSGTPFTIVITKSGTDELNIKNFSNFGDHGNAKCEMSGENSFVISAQDFNTLPGVEDTVSSGSGIYSKNGSQEKITMSYTVNGDNFNNVICTK